MFMILENGDKVRNIAPDVTDDYGRLKVMPAAYWASISMEERVLFCVRNGAYSLPTHELVGYLKAIIGKSSAIEIGSGNGVLCEALGIKGTDNYMQEIPRIRKIYESTGQRPITYGANVERIDGLSAIMKYKPQIVIGCWVTHIYRPSQHKAGGNDMAPDEMEILKNCEQYIMVGNSSAHKDHPLLQLKHEHSEPDWLYSRGFKGSTNFIGVWRGRK